MNALILDLIGPIADPSRAGERLEQGPSRWYLTGFLVPNERASVDLPKDDEDEDEEEDNDLFGPDDDPLDQPTAESVLVDDSDKNAAVVTSKRNFLPSSMGLSVLVPKGTTELKVTVRWGDYHPEFAPEKPAPEPAEWSFALASARPAPKPRKHPRIDAWARQQREKSLSPGPRGAFTHGLRRQGVPGSDGLSLEWLARPPPGRPSTRRLVPDGALGQRLPGQPPQGDPWSPQRPGHGLPGRADDPLRARLRPPPQPQRPRSDGRRRAEADLQYRDVCEFAVGHDVSADAEVDPDGDCQARPHRWVPHAEVERVEPARDRRRHPRDGELAALATHAEARCRPGRTW